MALDATVGGTATNSYLTVDDADAFATGDIGAGAAKWRESDTETKEQALMRATEDVDAFVGRVVITYYDVQGRLFPRSFDVDAADLPIVPPTVKKATYIQAAYLIRNSQALDDADSYRARGLESFNSGDGGGTLSRRGDDWISSRASRLLGAFTQGSVIGWIETT